MDLYLLLDGSSLNSVWAGCDESCRMVLAFLRQQELYLNTLSSLLQSLGHSCAIIVRVSGWIVPLRGSLQSGSVVARQWVYLVWCSIWLGGACQAASTWVPYGGFLTEQCMVEGWQMFTWTISGFNAVADRCKGLSVDSRAIHSFGCLPESHTIEALVELYQSTSICLLTAEGLRLLCSKSSLTPLIESPSLPQFPFDCDQAQQPPLTLLILRQSCRLALAQSFTPLVWGRWGGLSRRRPPAPQEKSNPKDRNSHFLRVELQRRAFSH